MLLFRTSLNIFASSYFCIATPSVFRKNLSMEVKMSGMPSVPLRPSMASLISVTPWLVRRFNPLSVGKAIAPSSMTKQSGLLMTSLLVGFLHTYAPMSFICNSHMPSEQKACKTERPYWFCDRATAVFARASILPVPTVILCVTGKVHGLSGSLTYNLLG